MVLHSRTDVVRCCLPQLLYVAGKDRSDIMEQLDSFETPLCAGPIYIRFVYIRFTGKRLMGRSMANCRKAETRRAEDRTGHPEMYCTAVHRLYKVECGSVLLPGRPIDSLVGTVDAFEAPTPP